jgi:hypothetical protein
MQDEKIMRGLRFLGYGEIEPDECDVCEDGSVWFGLMQVLPKGSVEPE